MTQDTLQDVGALTRVLLVSVDRQDTIEYQYIENGVIQSTSYVARPGIWKSLRVATLQKQLFAIAKEWQTGTPTLVSYEADLMNEHTPRACCVCRID